MKLKRFLGSNVLNFSSPARIRRFFGVGHKSKKKKLLETREVDVIVVDVDPPNENQDYSGFVDSGWFTFVPMTPMNKVIEIVTSVIEKQLVIFFARCGISKLPRFFFLEQTSTISQISVYTFRVGR